MQMTNEKKQRSMEFASEKYLGLIGRQATCIYFRRLDCTVDVAVSELRKDAPFLRLPLMTVICSLEVPQLSAYIYLLYLFF